MEPTQFDRGLACIAKGDVDEGIEELSRFLNSDFYHPEALFTLSAALLGKGFSGLAAVLLSAAIDARANKGKPFPEALMNLGACYKAERRNDVAEKIWNDALAQEPLPRERSKVMANIAGLYVNEGCPERALEWCDRALALDPVNHHAHANRGLACLELGRWAEGWDGWAHTFATGDRRRRGYGEAVRPWNGERGKHVIVWGDQGVGDEIFNAACLRDMQAICRKVTFDCHPRLVELFKRSFPEIEVHGTRKDLTELSWLRDSDAEFAVGIADLPTFLRRNGEWDGRPYLTAPAHPAARGNRLRIGLSWTGGMKKTRGEIRSLPLTLLRPIIEARDDVDWFSLQYTPAAAREVCELEQETGLRISHYPAWVECFDYDRTAQFVAGLDLVITVCTTIHHLGGALGVPTWTLVPTRPSWRYQVKGETLPWYGSVRLFRQDKDGDWTGVVERVAEAVAKC